MCLALILPKWSVLVSFSFSYPKMYLSHLTVLSERQLLVMLKGYSLSLWSRFKPNPLKWIHFKQIWIHSYDRFLWNSCLLESSIKTNPKQSSKQEKTPKISLPFQKQLESSNEWNRVWLVNFTLLNMPIALSKYLCSPAKDGRLLTCFLTLTRSASKAVGKVRTFRDDSDGDGIMWALNGSLLLHEALQKAMKAVQPQEMTGERGARLTNEYHSSHPTIACQASSHFWAASPSPWNLLRAEFIFLKTNLSLAKF